MDKDKGNKKKPLKLSSSGRLQIRKNLGPAGDKARTSGSKKTIQIVFKNKNNQQKSSSTTQSNFRGSSSLRSPRPGINSSAQPVTLCRVDTNAGFSKNSGRFLKSTLDACDMNLRRLASLSELD